MTPSPRHIIASPRPLQSLLAEIDETAASCGGQPLTVEQLHQQKFQLSQRLLADSDIHYEMAGHYATSRNKKNASRNSGFSSMHEKDASRMFSMDSILSSLAIQVTQFENNASSGDEEHSAQNPAEKADVDDGNVLDARESALLLEEIDATKELTSFVDAKLLAAENEHASKVPVLENGTRRTPAASNNSFESFRASSVQQKTSGSTRLRALGASKRFSTTTGSRSTTFDNPIMRRNALDEILGVGNDDEILLISDGENVRTADADDFLDEGVKSTKANGTKSLISKKRELDDAATSTLPDVGDATSSSAFPTARINRLSQVNKRKRLENAAADIESGGGNDEARIPPEKLSYYRMFKQLNVNLSDVELKLGFRYGVFGPFASFGRADSLRASGSASAVVPDADDEEDTLTSRNQTDSAAKPVTVDTDSAVDADDEADDADSTVVSDSEQEENEERPFGIDKRHDAGEDDER